MDIYPRGPPSRAGPVSRYCRLDNANTCPHTDFQGSTTTWAACWTVLALFFRVGRGQDLPSGTRFGGRRVSPAGGGSRVRQQRSGERRRESSRPGPGSDPGPVLRRRPLRHGRGRGDEAAPSGTHGVGLQLRGAEGFQQPIRPGGRHIHLLSYGTS